MAVRVESDADVGVSQSFGDDFGVDAMLKGECGPGLAAIRAVGELSSSRKKEPPLTLPGTSYRSIRIGDTKNSVPFSRTAAAARQGRCRDSQRPPTREHRRRTYTMAHGVKRTHTVH